MLFALEDVADVVGALPISSGIHSPAGTCNNAWGFLGLGPSGAGWKCREMHTVQ